MQNNNERKPLDTSRRSNSVFVKRSGVPMHGMTQSLSNTDAEKIVAAAMLDSTMNLPVIVTTPTNNSTISNATPTKSPSKSPTKLPTPSPSPATPPPNKDNSGFSTNTMQIFPRLAPFQFQATFSQQVDNMCKTIVPTKMDDTGAILKYSSEKYILRQYKTLQAFNVARIRDISQFVSILVESVQFLVFEIVHEVQQYDANSAQVYAKDAFDA